MKTAMVGLGRMGMNMARRLLQNNQKVVAYNRTPAKTEAMVKEGAEGAFSLQETVAKLTSPRVIWMMLPAGDIIDQHLDELIPLLSPGDIVVDGANSRYTDSIRRGNRLSSENIHFLDAGVSGGIWGLEVGYCLMVGGSREAFEIVEPLLAALAPKEGYLHCGPVGSGHYVKMIHNGIEYGMMQAYAEGFALLQASPFGEHLNLAQVAHLWNQGSVVRSWLLELAETAFQRDPGLTELEAFVHDSGEGRWTVEEAVDLAVPAPVLTMALMERFRSRLGNSFADRILAALRREFGGHAVKPSST
jgi:6-phosphogluconate dehydrogenase